MATKKHVEAEEKDQLQVDVVVEEKNNEEKEKKESDQAKEKDFKDYYHDLTKYFEKLFGKQAPKLPTGAVEPLLVIIPILETIFVILTGLGLLAFVGLSIGLAPIALLAGLTGAYTGYGILSLIISIITAGVSIYLTAKSLPGLYARTQEGWKYAYWSSLWSIVVSILNLNLLGAVLGGAISLYLLFQLKPHYK
ncbi:MAG: hypothetical protein OHK0017_02950 [Patescibacteria group bacterium]